MSALTFKRDVWRFCGNGCQSASKGKGGDRGPLMGQTVVFLLGRPINGDLERSGFCPSCVKEMKVTWEEALRERTEADRDWTRAVDEVAA